MRLYDTRTQSVAPLVASRTVRLYVCGITPYDSAHLGHAFTYLTFDVLARYLEHLGHRVIYVRNVTDVDDDILRKSAELGVDYLALAERETAAFEAALSALGCRPVDAAPRPTQSIDAIRTAVAGLLERGAAYALPDGRVYFDTGAAPQFGSFSRLDRDQMLAQFAEKGGDPEAAGKRDPLDFLLWQPSAQGEPAWASPWGPGRPGWHIECSVMVGEELGSVIDIHGGGSDLIYPHHEAEILQAEHLTSQAPFARCWMHVGMVALQGSKMSKSLGNLVFLSDLLEQEDAATVRRHLLARHYRGDWEHCGVALSDAADAIKKWRAAAEHDGTHASSVEAFHRAMRDDLDTPAALAAIDAAADAGAGATVTELAGILGFDLA